MKPYLEMSFPSDPNHSEMASSPEPLLNSTMKKPRRSRKTPLTAEPTEMRGDSEVESTPTLDSSTRATVTRASRRNLSVTLPLSISASVLPVTHRCRICAQEFHGKDRRTLIHHVSRLHLKERTYLCPYCPYALRAFSGTQNHQLIHLNGRHSQLPKKDFIDTRTPEMAQKLKILMKSAFNGEFDHLIDASLKSVKFYWS